MKMDIEVKCLLFGAAHSVRNCTKLNSNKIIPEGAMRKIFWRLKSLWIQASLMRIYYSKHVSGALKFV